MPTVSGRSTLPDGTTGLRGRWHIWVGIVSTGSGVRTGEQVVETDTNGDSSVVLPAGNYLAEFHYFVSGAPPRKVIAGPWGFTVATTDWTWGAVITSTGYGTFTPPSGGGATVTDNGDGTVTIS